MTPTPAGQIVYRGTDALDARGDARADAHVRKQFTCDVIEPVAKDGAADTSRVRRFVISTGSVDRDNDTIAPAGWKLGNYLRNPVVLFAHDYNSLPIGKALSVGLDADRLVATMQFADHPMADTCLKLVDGGFLRATSVGFRPIAAMRNEERNGVDFVEQELLEFSVVPVPANPEALMVASAAGIDVAPIKGWAEGVMKALAVHKVPPQAQRTAERADASTEMCPNCGDELADGKCPSCNWQSEPMMVPGMGGRAVGGDPVRWNRQLSKTFDVDGEPLEAQYLEYTWVSRFLETPIKDLYETTVHVPSPRMGAFLSALDESLTPFRAQAVRNITHSNKEVPPVYETIRLNSKSSKSFLVEGIRFLTGDYKMVAKVQPSWCGLALTLYAAAKGAAALRDFVDRTHVRAAQYKFLRGEAFALSGEFLTRGTETWDELFLAAVNLDPLKRTTQLLNEQAASMDPRGIILGGPAGTGKTLAGRVMMNMAPSATFIWLSARDLYRSGSFGGLTLAYDLAAENAPSVVFLEDIDSYIDRETIDLLKTELDGLKQRKGIVTILTTNFPQNLPAALIDRPGRFHDVLMLDLPTESLRRAMLAKWVPSASGATLDQLAKDTRTLSGAHLRDLVRFAETIRQQDGISIDDALKQALAKVQAQRQLIDQTTRPYLRAVKMFSTKAVAKNCEAPEKSAADVCSKCGKADCAVAVVICDECASALHPYSDEALLARAAQLLKRGRVLSAANETRLQAAKTHLSASVEELDAVLSQLAEIPDAGEAPAAAASPVAKEPAVTHVIELDDEDVEVLALDDDGLALDDEDEIDLSPTELSALVAATLRGALADSVRGETQAALARARGRVD